MTSIHYINLNQSGGASNESKAKKILRGMGKISIRQKLKNLSQEYNNLNDEFNDFKRKKVENDINQARAVQAAQAAQATQAAQAEQAAQELQKVKKIAQETQAIRLAEVEKRKQEVQQRKQEEQRMYLLAQTNKENVKETIPGATPALNCNGKMVYNVKIPNLINEKPSKIAVDIAQALSNQ